MLFFCAGSVLHGTKTRDMEQLGGLFKSMPWTGTTFLIGSCAISGLPPLNGFISEFLIYQGAFYSLNSNSKFLTLLGIIIIVSLAIIGALALLTFTRAFGITFLGALRNPKIEHIHESNPLMLYPMVILAGFCILISIGSPFVLKFLYPVIKDISIISISLDETHFAPLNSLLWKVSGISAAFILFILVILLLTNYLRHNRTVKEAETWGCGYNQISPRMQYTAYSFSKPVKDLFLIFFRTRKKVIPVKGYFPDNASMVSNTPDLLYDSFLRPGLSIIERLIFKFKWIQHGNLQIYVLYITVTLIILLVWKVS